MPYKDPEKQREAVKIASREFRERRKVERELLVKDIKKIMVENVEIMEGVKIAEEELGSIQQKMKPLVDHFLGTADKLKSASTDPELTKDLTIISTYLPWLETSFNLAQSMLLKIKMLNLVKEGFWIHMLLVLDKEAKKTEVPKLDGKPS